MGYFLRLFRVMNRSIFTNSDFTFGKNRIAKQLTIEQKNRMRIRFIAKDETLVSFFRSFSIFFHLLL